jgi:enoyl-CoA hydratase/carnithine racemase
MPTLTPPGGDGVVVLDLGADENRFNPVWMGSLLDCLHEALALPSPRALVTVASGPKIWSNGLDLDWLTAHESEAASFVDTVHNVFAAFLSAGIPTVAALTGHTFAAGAMLALAHDQRVMRTDRGFFCLPEVDIHIPFTPGMASLVQARLTKSAAHEAMTTGRRYTAEEALAAGIVDEIAPLDEVAPNAIARAAALAGKDAATLAAIKTTMYAGTLAALALPGGSLPV